MKISASKRIILLIIVMIIFLVLGVLAFFFRDILSDGIRYGRWFKVDRYEELFDRCKYTRSGEELILECTGLLESMSVYEGNDQGICYQYRLVPKGEGDISKEEFCEDSNRISLDNPYKELEKILPISIQIHFKRDNYTSYKFEKIAMVALSDDEIETMFESGKLGTPNTGAVLMNQLYGPYTDYLRYRGICCSANHPLLFVQGVYVIGLLGVKIEKAYVDGGYMYFVLNGHIDGQQKEYTVTVKSKGVVIVGLDGSNKYVTKESLGENVLNDIVEVRIAYASADFNKYQGDFVESCSSTYSEMSNEEKSLCDNLSISKEWELTERISVDRFIELISSKEDKELIFNNLFVNIIHIGK